MNSGVKNIDSMNFEELRSFVKVLANSVQELSDLYAKTKREYNDMLYNLSRDNLSIEYIAEQESMFEQTENGLKSVIAKNITGLRQFTEEEFKAATEVSSIDEMTDKRKLYKIPIPDREGLFTYYCYYAPLDMWVPISNFEQQKFSTIEQTAEKIATSVSETKQYVDDKLGDVELDEYTTIEQTADAITQTAYRGFSAEQLKNAENVSSSEFMDDVSKLYYISNDDDASRVYYAYNSTLERFMPIIDGQSIYTVFKQTADRFEFKGNVIIDGDAVITKNLKAQKIVSQDGNEIALLTIAYNDDNVSFPDLTYYGKVNDKYQELFGIRYDGAGTSYIRLNGTNIGYVGINKEKFYPLGTWCFSENNGTAVEGLGVVPVFGG